MSIPTYWRVTLAMLLVVVVLGLGLTFGLPEGRGYVSFLIVVALVIDMVIRYLFLDSRGYTTFSQVNGYLLLALVFATGSLMRHTIWAEGSPYPMLYLIVGYSITRLAVEWMLLRSYRNQHTGQLLVLNRYRH